GGAATGTAVVRAGRPRRRPTRCRSSRRRDLAVDATDRRGPAAGTDLAAAADRVPPGGSSRRRVGGLPAGSPAPGERTRRGTGRGVAAVAPPLAGRPGTRTRR